MIIILIGLVPERTYINSHNLRSTKDLAHIPQKRAIYPYQILRIYLVCLVQHTSYLVSVWTQFLDDILQLIRRIQFVRVKHQKNEIRAIGHPPNNGWEII